MKFKEVFEKYKNGEVTKTEKEFIDEEIEKNEIINEYLADSLMDKFETFDNNETISVKKIKKKVDKKFRGIILKSVMGIVAIFIFIQIIVDPITSLLFYNPSKFLDGESSESTLFLDMSTFTELHFPEYRTSYATTSEDLGFGKHELKIYQQNKFDNKDTTFEGKLVRGKLKGNNEALYLMGYNNIFYEKGNSTFEAQTKKEFDSTKDLLKEVSKSSLIASYLSFKEDMSMDELLKFKEKYDLSISWVAINSDYNRNEMMLGFNLAQDGKIIELDKKSNEMYPYLSLGTEYMEDSEEITGEILETHYKSLLKYMSTRDEFLSAFYNVNGIYNGFYKDSLRYIEDNGIKTYGIRIDSTSDELLQILEDENINSVFIQDAKFSVLER